MKILNLDEALELYELLDEYLPNDDNPDSIINFVGKIVNNIKESGKHEIYLYVTSLLSDIDKDELLSMTSNQVLELFVEGVINNKLPSLKKFCQTIGYTNG